MKIYRMKRVGGCADAEVWDGEIARPLNPRLDLRRHSPSGFEWGYGGSGPAQLALAILADALGDRPALELYQEFKWEVVAWRPRDQAWEITENDIYAVVSRIEAASSEVQP